MALKNKILTYQDTRGDENRYPPKRTWSDKPSTLYSSYKCLTFKELNDNYLMETDSYVGNENRLVFENQFPTSKIFSYQLTIVFKSRSTLPKFPIKFSMNGYLGTVNYGGNSGIKDVEWGFQQIYSTSDSQFDLIESYTFEPMHVREDEGQFVLWDDEINLVITAYYGLNDTIAFSYRDNIANNFNTYTLYIANNQYTIQCNPIVEITPSGDTGGGTRPSPSVGASLRVDFVNGNNMTIFNPSLGVIEYSNNKNFTVGTVKQASIGALQTRVAPYGTIGSFVTDLYQTGTTIYIRAAYNINRLQFGSASRKQNSAATSNDTLIAYSPNSEYISYSLRTDGINTLSINLTYANTNT